jgi:ferritin-like metal-binding protein YciE
MGLFSKEIKKMDDLLIHVVQDIYYAEQHILKELPAMIDKATNRDLTATLKDHLRETEQQIARLEQVFGLLGEKPKGVSCPAIDGVLREAKEVAGEISDTAVLDAGIIAAAQAVEHYEITRYGSLVAWADELGKDAVSTLLQRTLKEEQQTYRKLSAIAIRKINAKAAG